MGFDAFFVIIHEKLGDYILALKENHPEVYVGVTTLFDDKDLGEAEYTEITKDRGRIEKWEAEA